MKHRALSMLLALVMVVSLLPIAAIANGAEENTGDEEQEETVEMGENDSQQGGDGEKSQLPTEENEKTAIQLYVEKKGGATSYTRYQYDENVRLPWLVYVNESDGEAVPAFNTFKQNNTVCYAIQKAAELLHIGIEDTIAFGDSMNDYEMIEKAGCGVVMANGDEYLKTIADRICESVQEDGVVRELERMHLI